MPAGKPVGLPKSGGRSKGTPNKVKPIILAPTDANRALALMAPTAEVRTPKAVMLDAMLFFDQMAREYHKDGQPGLAAKSMIAAVQCAEKVAPYIHARLIAMESRDDALDRPAFVIRAPAVMTNSAAWQEAVGVAVMDMEASQAPSGGQGKVLAAAAVQSPSESQPVPASTAVALAADPKTNRITVMPPGPRTVQPSGTQEWLDSVKKVG